MRPEPNTRPKRIWEITVESNWLDTLAAVALFIVCGLLLVREINHFIWGHLSGPARLHRSFWSIWNKVFEAIAAIYCFLFAFNFSNKYVKTACVLMGIDLSASILLSCFHMPPGALHIAAMSGSAIRQAALTVFCLALAQWLGSVVRWGRQPENPGGES